MGVHSCPTNVFETGTGDEALRTSAWEDNLVRAFDRLQKNRPILLDFWRNIWDELCHKTVSKKWQILQKIDWFCSDLTSVFIFLTEIIICSFNSNTLKKRTNSKAFNMMAIVPSFFFKHRALV